MSTGSMNSNTPIVNTTSISKLTPFRFWNIPRVPTTLKHHTIYALHLPIQIVHLMHPSDEHRS